MILLHTSDWHLGRTLCGRQRHAEQEAFLDWLITTLRDAAVDVLLVAGDLFDTTTPGTRAQELYYQILCRIATTPCRHVVIIGGNHDSPAFLNAPGPLLKALNIHIVGCATDDPADEVLTLTAPDGAPELIVAAVPYLRDRDIRRVAAGEDSADKEQKLVQGVADHYAAVTAVALARQRRSGHHLPLVALGHLFAAGGRRLDDDGLRDLYVGALAHVDAATFAADYAYVALGHLHQAQSVAQNRTIRYSGAPLPHSFGEAQQQKSVNLVKLSAGTTEVTQLPLPTFQRLARLSGDWQTITSGLQELTAADESIWLEVDYCGHEVIGDLRQQLELLLTGSRVELLRVKNSALMQRTLAQQASGEELADLDPFQVFERCLAAHHVPPEQQPQLQQTYREAVALVESSTSEAAEITQ